MEPHLLTELDYHMFTRGVKMIEHSLEELPSGELILKMRVFRGDPNPEYIEENEPERVSRYVDAIKRWFSTRQ